MLQLHDRRSFIRSAAGAVFIAILMNMNGFFSGSPLKIALNILILATYIIRFVYRGFWQTRRKSLVFVALAAAETAAGMIFYHENVLLYFLAIIVVTTTIRLVLGTKRIPMLAVMITIAGLYTAFGDESLSSFVSFVIIAVFFFFTVQSRRQRDAINEENKRNLVELQEAYVHLQEASVTSMRGAVMDERTRIAREIHDAVGHSLTSLIVQMQALRYMIVKDPERAEQSLAGMLEVARQGLQDIRTSVHSLADDRTMSGLASIKAQLARMEATANITYSFEAKLPEEEITVENATLLFRLMQEAITNIVRHSEAEYVDVRVWSEEERIVLIVQDNGKANASEAVREGFGLKTMRARLEEAGGRLTFGAAVPNGFQIRAELPISVAEEETKETKEEIRR
ncbi:sensor histidine kinase [Paenibacillus sp. OV219]|uniref:sensor histidine kinase n=1 Tax=Paenibacillus sp. OV219 TaxID=1884377 RepID=UPI0008B67F7F|nr:sensor histidine kinase [Paenibacillus sp. OV219]SEO81658.1 Signal transduction histidine kinase [Paenibacillus sp. OV219]